MKFIVIHLQCTWGERQIVVNVNFLKSITYDVDQSEIWIETTTKKIEGHCEFFNLERFKDFLSCPDKVFYKIRMQEDEVYEKNLEEEVESELE